MRRMGQGILLVVFVAGFLARDGWVPTGGPFAGEESEVPATNPLSGNKAAIREGRSWFGAVCGPCHGGAADGRGERGHGADLRVFNKGFRKFVETVKNGRDTGLAMKMPPWRGVLTDEQIYQIGAYLETLAKEGANWKEPTN